MGGEVAEVAMRSNESVGSRDVAEIVDGRSRELGLRSWGWLDRCWNDGPQSGLLTPDSFPFQALRHCLIKLLLSLQEGIKVSEKHPRLRALNDSVVVRAGDGDDFRAGDFANRAGRDDR